MRIVDQLAPALMAAAVALQLPSDRLPSGPNWTAVENLCMALDCHSLHQAAREYSGSLQLVRAAAQLLRLTTSQLTGQALDDATVLRSMLSSILRSGLAGCAGRLSERPHAFEQLWRTLPTLQLQLQLMGPITGEAADLVCFDWHLLVSLLCASDWCAQECESPSGSSGYQLAALLHAVADALRTLPILATASKQQQPQQQHEQQAQRAQRAQHTEGAPCSRPSALAGALLRLCLTASRVFTSRAQRAQEADPGAMTAVWQLHSTACRVAHWFAADSERWPLLLCDRRT